MTPPTTRREHIAAIRERDEGFAGVNDLSPMSGPDSAITRAYDRRYLLGVVGELAAALRGVMVIGEYQTYRDARALLADLGPDA